MYSLRMSFWMVPDILSAETPRFSATAMYMQSRMAAVELMVMEVDTWSRGMPSKRISMSARESMATPTFPTSPAAMEASESYPICVGRSNATDNPVWPAERRYLYRSLDSLAVPKPAYWRMVQKRPR